MSSKRQADEQGASQPIDWRIFAGPTGLVQCSIRLFEGGTMFNPWYTTMMLAAESCNVIALRTIKMAFGGREARDEAHLMVTEKIVASWEAGTALMTGGNTFGVIDRYREHVAANATRLATL